MIRLHVVYGGTMECRTYKTMKAAQRAFANRMLDRSNPDCIIISVNGVDVVSFGRRWY